MAQSVPEPALNINYVEKEDFKPTLKHGEGVCLPDPNRKMVPQQRSLITEGSASILFAETLGTTSRPVFFEQSVLLG